MKIVECVPNFSEGRDQTVINKIADAIKSVEGVSLLDIDPGFDTNRTVYTFVGEPEAVKKAAFKAIEIASTLIDMSKHRGAHPRMGATDVCPFIPVKNVSMEECVKLVEELGKEVGEKLGIPVYLYEYASKHDYRRKLEDIRKGEYEALEKKLSDPEWKPDFGPTEFNEKVKRTGATAIGARDFLIAYNINLNTKDPKLANKIAKIIRESGRTIKDENGNKVKVPGKLKYCKAIGWYVDDYKRAQISINLTNYKVTNLYHAFEAAKEEAEKIGLRVTGSEIVGLVPEEALFETGMYYIQKQGGSTAVSRKDIIDIAIYSLGLNDVAKFDPEEKIIEWKIADKTVLSQLTIEDFTDELASNSPAPGGGSVAALAGALSASLVSMVGNLTYKKKAYKEHWDEANNIATIAFRLKEKFTEFINKDTEAFNKFMAALKLPKKTEEQQLVRKEAIEEATKGAIKIPLDMIKIAINEVIHLIKKMEEIGNKNAYSDVVVSAVMLKAAIKSAYYNVLINLGGIEDQNYKQNIENELKPMFETLKDLDDMIEKMENNLKS